MRLAGVEAEVNAGPDATFATFVGASPIPNQYGFNFLNSDAKSAVTISKAASEIVPAFDVEVTPRGEGFALAAG